MNALTHKCRELHIKPADAMDILQLAGIVSDTAVTTEDVAGDDVPRAVEFISHEAN